MRVRCWPSGKNEAQARRRHPRRAPLGERISPSLLADSLRLLLFIPPRGRRAAVVVAASSPAGRTCPNRPASARPCTTSGSSSARPAARGRARGRRSSARRACRRPSDRVDQRIDGGIGDAGDVARAGHLAGCRAEQQRRPSPGVATRELRRVTMSKSNSSRRRWYCAASTMRKRASMPSSFMFLMQRARVRLQRAGEVEELDLERLAIRQAQDVAVALAAGFAQQGVGPAQQSAVLSGAVGDRRNVGLAEHLVGQLARGTARAARLPRGMACRSPSCRSSRSTRSCAGTSRT